MKIASKRAGCAQPDNTKHVNEKDRKGNLNSAQGDVKVRKVTRVTWVRQSMVVKRDREERVDQLDSVNVTSRQWIQKQPTQPPQEPPRRAPGCHIGPMHGQQLYLPHILREVDLQLSILVKYTMILAAHFEGDVESIAPIATRDPINRGYVDLSAINGGWVPYWRYAQWMDAETRDKFYLDYRGNVTVIEGGIYYVYSQMLYYDPSVFMGHSLYIGGQKRFSCTECTVDRDRKFNTCYIGGVVQINPGDKVGVKVSYANRVINLNPDSTHFGMIRLS